MGEYNNQRNPRNMPQNGRRPQKRRKKPEVPPTVIAIYVVMVLIILAICAVVFVVTLKNTENTSDSSDLSNVSSSAVVSDSSDMTSSSNVESSSDISSESSVTSSDSNTVSSSASSSESTPQSSSSSGSDGQPVVYPLNYSKEFFENDLFIGDSIFTGLSGYGYLDSANVAAKIGYTPSGALNKAFDATGITAVDYAKQRQPKRIFIMLGSNTMASGTNYDVIVSQYTELVKQLRANCPKSLICVMSIPPVTADSSAAKTGNITNENIRSVNAKLKSMAAECKVDYFDINKMFSDSDGNFNKDLAEQDGLHFMGSTYKIMLAELETELSSANTTYYIVNS